MSTPVFRRLANPLSIWIALLAIVLQSVMPMVAQARMRVVVPAGEMHAVDARVAVAAHGHGVGGHDRHAHEAGHDVVAMADALADDAVDGASNHTASQLVTVSTDHASHPPSDSPANPHALHGDAPCPYCRVHLDALALPVLPNPHWVLLVSVIHRAIEHDAIPALPEAWSQTRPRGPPVMS
ncbi:hypothetical protein FXN63_01745 [Pigmentiphaga aceris]|uniref:DUF2946 domain-containing protein n=1 Tax=Pigmentiphaga aceris TaxID=1940612 RepID=A0A5C0ARU5_9BURK|nr:DUF2946 family protein [Pigmentiphaga aceris]QEI04705.1 hypothetical protein FXN63_01745 [Pigmentiphaga aceris]